MVKSDFKNGMSFKTRYGDKCYIIDSKVYKNSDKDESILGLWGSLEECLESYDNELLVHESPHGADIMEVYDIENNLIWERDEIDWSKVPVDTKVLVRNSYNHRWDKRYFAKYEDGKVFTFINGYSSWSVINTNYITSWKYARLAETDEPKKEVTLQEIEKTFTKFCVNQRKDDYTRGCSKCIYNDTSRKINGTSCKIKWLLDNYNVTEQ